MDNIKIIIESLGKNIDTKLYYKNSSYVLKIFQGANFYVDWIPINE